MNALKIFKKWASILGVILLCNQSKVVYAEQLPVQSDWLHIIREIPYQYSKNFHNNLSTIRQWVLLETGYCEQQNRHLLYNRRGEFLAYIENEWSKSATQEKLNETRLDLVKRSKVKQWIRGSEDATGYPFAFNCNQPHANIEQAINRLLGIKKSDRLWGTWDGISAGTKYTPVSLYELVEKVYKIKSERINQSVNSAEFRYFLAQIIIESGARKNRISSANAIGLLQLKPEVLKDCRIPKKFYKHRMAQVDCAVRLFQQNRRNLRKVFEPVFGHLPKAKQDVIFSMLLIQSYHSGIGRMSKLLESRQQGAAANYFAKNHQDFSAEDIATGLIYHNMGREGFGLASLYYVIDVAVVADKLCKHKELASFWACQ
jgi:hypothetical protein